MRFLLGLLVLLLFTKCQNTRYITYHVAITPAKQLQPAPQKVVVLNTFDPALQNQRKNKEALITRLTDTLLKQMAAQLQLSGLDVETLYGVTPVFNTADEGSIVKLVAQHHAAHALVIKEVDVYFDQTAVEVTRTQTGKSREAFYDICSDIRYELYHTSGKIESRPVRHHKPHSSRSVISGVLAAGPALSSNSKDFYQLISENKNLFLHDYFAVFIPVQRSLFTHGAFKRVGNAVQQQNFETALKESLLLTESSSREIVAKAYYNCAVLSERLQNRATAQKYLQQSLHTLRLPPAVQMQYSLHL